MVVPTSQPLIDYLISLGFVTTSETVGIVASAAPLSEYQSVWRDDFKSLSLRTGGPTQKGLSAGKGTWSAPGLYYYDAHNGGKGFMSFAYGFWVDPSYNWKLIDPNYYTLGQQDITADGLVLLAGSNFPLIQATLPKVSHVTTNVTPSLSSIVSNMHSFGMTPPFYRETVYTIPNGPNDWSAVWGDSYGTQGAAYFEIDDQETLGLPDMPIDAIHGGFVTYVGGNGGIRYNTGTPIANRQLTIGMQVTSSHIYLYYGGRPSIGGKLIATLAIPSTATWNQMMYSMFDLDVGYSWKQLFLPVTESKMTVRSIEYFAPSLNTAYKLPPPAPVPTLTWGQFAGNTVPVASAPGTVVASLSGAASYSVLGYAGLAVSGSNLVTVGTLVAGTHSFYIRGVAADGTPGIVPKMSVVVS